MRNYLKEFLRNPLAIAVLAILGAIGMISLSETYFLAVEHPFVGHVVEKAAEAVFVAGAFGLLFEYLSKTSLIDEAVKRAVGQQKALDLGLLNLERSAEKIDYGPDLQNSSIFIVSTRFADHFFQRNKGGVLSRLASRKPIELVVMKPGGIAELMPGYDPKRSTAVDFLQKLCREDVSRKASLSIREHENPFCYSFVKSDAGIWVKFYWNSQNSNPPPAVFFANGSPMFDIFDSDIQKLIAQSKVVPL
jgi:hypothetical protein